MSKVVAGLSMLMLIPLVALAQGPVGQEVQQQLGEAEVIDPVGLGEALEAEQNDAQERVERCRENFVFCGEPVGWTGGISGRGLEQQETERVDERTMMGPSIR
jgi:hypothetical protein